MELLQILRTNWDSVLVVVLGAGVVLYLIGKRQWKTLDRLLFALVTWAERTYGGSTGSLKLAAVIEKLYPHIPAVVRLFVSTATLEKLVEQALIAAKKRWETNPALLSG